MRRAAILLAAAAAALLALRPAAALPPAGPVASLDWSPPSPRSEAPVTFTITGSDADGPVTGGKLEYGDGSHELFFAPSTAVRDITTCVTGDHQRTWTLRHVYRLKGSYQARLTVNSGSCPGFSLLVSDQTVVSYTVEIS